MPFSNIVKNKCIQKAMTIGLTLFYGILMFFMAIYNIIRLRSAFFQVKRRDAPPQCLQDASLGNHHIVQLDKIKLHYVSNDANEKPTMVFIHGFPEFWFSWRYQLREFSKDYHVVAPDLRGYGDSEKPAGVENYTVELITEDIFQLIKSLKKGKVTVVAHDWGGIIGWYLAAKYPEIVERLIILNAPHPLAFKESLVKSWKQFLMSWYMFFFNNPLLPELVLLSNDLNMFNNMFRTFDGKSLLVSDDEIEAYKYTYSKPQAITCPLNFYRSFMRGYSFKTQEALRIKMPVLILWGENDTALSTTSAKLSAKHCDEVTIKFIKDCSHWIQLERHEVVNQYIREYLQKK